MFEGLLRPGHLLIILVIAMLVFGPSKLPQLGESLGKAIRDFKKAVNDPPRESNGQAAPKALEDKNG